MDHQIQPGRSSAIGKKPLWSRTGFWVGLVLFVVGALIAIPIFYMSQSISPGSNWSRVMEAMTSDMDSWEAERAWYQPMIGVWTVENNGTTYDFKRDQTYTALTADGGFEVERVQITIAGDNYVYLFIHADEPGDDLESLMKWGEFYEASFDGDDRMIWKGPHSMMGRSLEQENIPTIYLNRVRATEH